MTDRTSIQTKEILQPTIMGNLSDAITHGRMPHTVLISGKSGYGLLQTGILLARKLLCRHTDEAPCEQCTACHQSAKLQHPDLHLFFPTTDTKSRCSDHLEGFRNFLMERPYGTYADWLEWLEQTKRPLNIYTNTVEDINHVFDFKSYQGGAKVIMIWGAEFLGKEGNKLLKVIEEPPERNYIILLAERRKAILSTILSRSQSQLLSPLTTSQIIETLGWPDDEEHIHLAERSDGDIALAINLINQETKDYQSLWLTLLREAYRHHPPDLIATVDKVVKLDKNAAITFMDNGLKIVKTMIRCQVGIPIDDNAAVEKLAQLLTLPDLEAIADRLQEDRVNILRNSNLKILFTSLALFLAEVFMNTKRSASNS